MYLFIYLLILGRDEEEGLIITSLPEGLNTKPVDERGKESGRPRSMMFVRSITGDQTDNNKDKKANTSRYCDIQSRTKCDFNMFILAMMMIMMMMMMILMAVDSVI